MVIPQSALRPMVTAGSGPVGRRKKASPASGCGVAASCRMCRLKAKAAVGLCCAAPPRDRLAFLISSASR